MTTPVICFNFTNSSIHFWCNSVHIQALKILSNTLGLPIYIYTNLVVNILCHYTKEFNYTAVISFLVGGNQRVPANKPHAGSH